ncbi:hypothetical protein, partial [Microbacterium sp. B19(2022)]|uniref:hypothetical protein n=1 Tax=Microbacterium sp. B19(2022) TaxID=2914045 RepID=UPI00197B1A4E
APPPHPRHQRMGDPDAPRHTPRPRTRLVGPRQTLAHTTTRDTTTRDTTTRDTTTRDTTTRDTTTRDTTTRDTPDGDAANNDATDDDAANNDVATRRTFCSAAGVTLGGEWDEASGDLAREE